jgi:predicted permease
MWKVVRRLRYAIRRRQFEADLREELDFHQQSRRFDLELHGRTPQDVARGAVRLMGNITLAQEDAQAVWIAPWFQSVRQDAAYAVRSLRRQPAFAIVSLIALATSIGLSVSVFTVFNTIVLRPWPVRNPGQVLAIFTKEIDGVGGFSVFEYQYVAAHATSFSGVVARWSVGGVSFDEAGPRTRGSAVSGNYFDVLGVGMIRGRGFLLEEDRVEASPLVMILNYRLWQARFGGEPDIVGRRIRLNGIPFTVVGVAASDFTGIEPAREDYWIPLAALPRLQPAGSPLADLLRRPNLCCADVAGRMGSGATRARARAEFEVYSRQFRAQFGLPPREIVVSGTRFFERPDSKRKVIPLLGLMFLGVMLVLALACANVGNLLLARAVARRHEIAVRLSLGASRGRLVRQLLTESGLFSLGAGFIGTAVAYWLPTFILDRAGQHPPFSVVPDTTVLGFALLLTLVACVGAGLAPALHATRGELAVTVKEGRGVSATRMPLRGLLLAIQLAVSVCLLVGAALLARSVQDAQSQDIDFAIGDVSVVSFEFPAAASDPLAVRAFFTELADGFRTAHVGPFAFASSEPLPVNHGIAAIRIPGHSTEQQWLPMESVSAGYFDLLRIPIVAGRSFDTTDVTRQEVLVNESFVRRFWREVNPIGRTLAIGSDVCEVVGVVKDAHTARLDQVEPTVYRSFASDPAAVALIPIGSSWSGITSIASRIDPRVRPRIAPLSDNLARLLTPARAGATLAGLLGLFALVLAAIGVSGVFGYVVHQRRYEIGIRMALGATQGQVVQLVLAGHARSLLAGLMIGFLCAVAGSRLLERYLYGISPLDPAAFAAVGVILAAAALAATYGPARRASRVDPAATLRAQ